LSNEHQLRIWEYELSNEHQLSCGHVLFFYLARVVIYCQLGPGHGSPGMASALMARYHPCDNNNNKLSLTINYLVPKGDSCGSSTIKQCLKMMKPARHQITSQISETRQHCTIQINNLNIKHWLIDWLTDLFNGTSTINQLFVSNN